MNQESVTHEFDPMFAENMSEFHKLHSMIISKTEKLSLRLNVMKETYEQAMSTQYENGYIQGFKDRYEGLQPRYKDINEKTKEWYDYYTMETHRLHQLNFREIELEMRELRDENSDLQEANQTLKEQNSCLKECISENEETIKRLQVDLDELMELRRIEQHKMTNLITRNYHIQNDSRRTNDEMIDLEKRCHKFSCELQDEIHILKEDNQRLKDENSDLEQENQIILKEENQRLQKVRDNEKTINKIQVDRGEFQYALVKARDELMELRREEKEEMINLRTRNCLLLKENQENKEKMKRIEANISEFISCQLKAETLTEFISCQLKAETLQTDIYYNSKV